MLKNENLVADFEIPLANQIVLLLSRFSLSGDFLTQLCLISILVLESLALIVSFLTSMYGARNSLSHDGVRITSPSCVADILEDPVYLLGDPNFFEGLPPFGIKRFVATHGRFTATLATAGPLPLGARCLSKGYLIIWSHLIIVDIEM